MIATLSDNTNVMVDAKYTMEQLKLYAGYEWIQFKNPSDPFTLLHDGFTDIAGDFVCFQCTLINGTAIIAAARASVPLPIIEQASGTQTLAPLLRKAMPAVVNITVKTSRDAGAAVRSRSEVRRPSDVAA
jgi:hypothetical protein